jgi:diguanylate cyclase (GGDEF)-like protein/PAS domain S-box-containing protein
MLIVVLAALGVAARVLIAHFDAIEIEQTRGKVVQGMRAIEADLNQLAISTRDYAEWDDTQQFVINRNTDYLDLNFTFESLSSIEVDVLAMIAADGTVVHSAERAKLQGSLVSPASPSLLGRLQTLVADRDHLQKLDLMHRLVGTEHGIAAFSAVEVRRSDMTDPTGVRLFFVRYLDHDAMVRARKTSQLRLDLYSTHESSGRLPPDVAQWIDTAPPGQAMTGRILDAQRAMGYALLRDVEDHPIAVLSVASERTVGALGRRTTGMALGAIATLLLICTVVGIIMALNLRRSTEARATLERRHRNILKHLDESIVLADRETLQIIDANEALVRELGYEPADLEHLTLSHVYLDLSDWTDDMRVKNTLMRARDGRLIEVEVTVTYVVDDGRALVCVVGRDLALRKQAEELIKASEDRLAQVLESDELTGLASRAGLQRKLHERLEGANRDTALSLFHIDLDHFKNVNDLYGHAFGDRALAAVAKELRVACGESSLLARMGGDEFALVCESNDPVIIRLQAQRIQDALRRELKIGERSITLAASLGVAVFPQDGKDVETLLKRADIAMYQAKDSGRDTFRQFSADMDAHLSENMALEQALRRAIDSPQIYVEYQPVIDLQTGLLTSFEALARWRHPEMGNVSPARFIPAAERTGLILRLGEQIVREVVAQLRQWREEGVPLAPVAVNVSSLQFERSAFSNFVHELLLRNELDPQWLSFEITESAWLQDSDKHVVAIDTLRHGGSRIYIDDFGTGFSNLSYLKSLPVDALKIDQSFVRGMSDDQNDVAIVSGIIHMASQLKLQTIAEGVETAEIADKLRSLGCHYAQGYYFSKPMPAMQCRALLMQLKETRRFTQTGMMRAVKMAANG